MGKSAPGRNKKKKGGIPSCPTPGIGDEQIVVEKEVVKLFRCRLKETFRKIGLRELIGECADTYCTFCDDHTVILQYSNEIRQSILFELSQAKNVGEVTSWLDCEMSGFVKEVLEKNQKNYEYSVSYMERVLDLYIGQYKAYLDKLMKKTLNMDLVNEDFGPSMTEKYSGDINKYLERYDNLDKPGNAEFHRRNRLTLKACCDAIFEKVMITRNNLAKETESWISNTTTKKHLEQTALKMKQTELFHGRNQFTYSENNQSTSAHRDVFTEIPDDKEHMRKKCKQVFKNCMREYKDEMRKLLKEKLITEEDSGLECDHARIIETILLKFDNEFIEKTEMVEILRFRQALKEKLEDELDDYSDKWDTTRSVAFIRIENFLLKLQLETTDFLCELLTTSDSGSVEVLNCAYQKHLEDLRQKFCNNSRGLCENYRQKILNQLQSKADVLFKNNFDKVLKACEIDLKILSRELQDEYLKNMRKSLSEIELLEGDDLLVLHNCQKSKTISEFNNHKHLTISCELHKKLTSDLVSQLDLMFDNMKRTHNVNIETRAAVSELAIKCLLKHHVTTLKKKALLVKNEEDLHKFHNLERKKLLEEFKTMNLIPVSSSRSRCFELKLLKQIDEASQEVWKDFGFNNETSITTVVKYYEKELPNCLLLQSTKPLLNELDSYIQCHEKAIHVAISSSVLNYIKPISRNAIIQAKMQLDTICKEKFTQDPIIGIDFGSNYCRCAVYINGKIEMIPTTGPLNEKIITSMASFVGVEELSGCVGKEAKWRFLLSNEVTPIIYGIKQIIHAWSNFNGLCDSSAWWFEAEQGHDYNSGPLVFGLKYLHHVTDLVAELFQKLREVSETFVKESVRNCVITFHHLYGHNKQRILRDAAKKAGFSNVTLVEEHRAILEYVFLPLNTRQKVVLIDAGSMTRVYVLIIVNQKITLQGYEKTRGGMEFLNEMANYCDEQFSDQNMFICTGSTKLAKVRKRRLLESCEKAMITLSTSYSATGYVADYANGWDLAVNITRKKFEQLNISLFIKVANCIKDALLRRHRFICNVDVGALKETVDEVLLVGGCSKIPKLRETVEYFFNKRPLCEVKSGPDDAFAYGAALHGLKVKAKELHKKEKNAAKLSRELLGL